VLRPPRRDSFLLVRHKTPLETKLAFYLKESLGTSTELLARFTQALSRDLRDQEPTKLRYVWLGSRPARGRKRPGWKREFLRNLKTAAGDPSGVGESDIKDAVRGYRAEKKLLPEISVGGSKKDA
jgi:hypothetical protein